MPAAQLLLSRRTRRSVTGDPGFPRRGTPWSRRIPTSGRLVRGADHAPVATRARGGCRALERPRLGSSPTVPGSRPSMPTALTRASSVPSSSIESIPSAIHGGARRARHAGDCGLRRVAAARVLVFIGDEPAKLDRRAPRPGPAPRRVRGSVLRRAGLAAACASSRSATQGLANQGSDPTAEPVRDVETRRLVRTKMCL